MYKATVPAKWVFLLRHIKEFDNDDINTFRATNKLKKIDRELVGILIDETGSFVFEDNRVV